MIFTSNRYKNKNLSLIAALFISLTVLLGLQACSSSDSTPADANPTGYYTGTAAVKDATDADLDIQDLQGMISGTRFIAFSNVQKLIYDGTITDITESNFTASVTIYQSDRDDILVVNTTTISGTITEGSQVTGTINGTGAFNGDFSLLFSLDNQTDSTSASIITPVGQYWVGAIYPYSHYDITVDSAGLTVGESIPGGALGSCRALFSSSITPIPDSILFNVSQTFVSCSEDTANTVYTGLAMKKPTEETLVMAFSNGIFATSADYTIQ